jgi:hypothetical protein
VSARRSPLARAATLLAMVAALVLLGAGGIDAILGQEVTLVHAAKSPAEQVEWRRLRDPHDDPAEIYGQPEGAPLRVVLLDRTRLIDPPEAPGRLLLPVDRARGDVPLQSRTMWMVAAASAVGALALAGVLALIARVRRRPTTRP